MDTHAKERREGEWNGHEMSQPSSMAPPARTLRYAHATHPMATSARMGVKPCSLAKSLRSCHEVAHGKFPTNSWCRGPDDEDE